MPEVQEGARLAELARRREIALAADEGVVEARRRVEARNAAIAAGVERGPNAPSTGIFGGVKGAGKKGEGDG